MNFPQSPSIAVIGLGYVGLPLAMVFSRLYRVIGFDLNARRIKELSSGHDRSGEVPDNIFENPANKVTFTNDPQDIKDSDFFVIAVPTPVASDNSPDLAPLKSASETAGRAMKKGSIVVYESTVYPGCTEEVCIPILEKESGLSFNSDFFAGYSPERINPGDRERTIDKILKITSGSTPDAAVYIDKIYSSVISAGTYPAPSIKVAEAAKIVENTQRDLNIAIINELAMIFGRMNLDTLEVLEAAGTKWNFLPFRPGLVGGHCIGVDPYYLTHKAQETGFYPELILAGRRLNSNMGIYIASDLVKLMIKHGIIILGSKVIVMGFTFKENCSDIRNTRVVDIIRELSEYGCKVDVYDPLADPEETETEYGVKLLRELPSSASYHAFMLAVSHAEFKLLNPRNFLANNGVVYDVKGFLPKEAVDRRL
ncbi:Vi polysaccharide biosynthesis protein VipA/TviB [Spirochaetia bacterium]|nr:Vi polysaccharide biosynthesis protein VipA/TviB [Spirochaetia bacterium]